MNHLKSHTKFQLGRLITFPSHSPSPSLSHRNAVPPRSPPDRLLPSLPICSARFSAHFLLFLQLRAGSAPFAESLLKEVRRHRRSIDSVRCVVYHPRVPFGRSALQRSPTSPRAQPLCDGSEDQRRARDSTLLLARLLISVPVQNQRSNPSRSHRSTGGFARVEEMAPFAHRRTYPRPS